MTCVARRLLLLALSSSWLGLVLIGERRAFAEEPPEIPFGFDAYTQWDKWPVLRIGVRAYLRSTFDRMGSNHEADSGHYLRQVEGGRAGHRGVVMDETGPGILWFVRHNHWHGSPWTYTVDGTATVVTESSTADPVRPRRDSVFMPEELFPRGLTYTWSTTKGADLSWVPMPFERSLQLDYGRAFYGTGYFILWKTMPGLRLSRPLSTWERRPPPQSVLDLIARSGSDIAPRGPGVTTTTGTLSLRPFETRTLAVLGGAPTSVRRLAFRVPVADADTFWAARLRIWWDDRPEPSVDGPAGLFFGTGSLMRTPEQKHIVRSFPMTVTCDRMICEFATYFPMPFQRRARIELGEAQGKPLRGVRWEIRSQRHEGPANAVGLFHATYRRHPTPERGRDLVVLDTPETEGGGARCGHFVGTTYLFTRAARLATLEGDPRFFFDDSSSPQGHATGSEEWGGGGDYWGGQAMTLPFAGHPVGKPAKDARTEQERIHSAYRFLLGDLMPFGRNARVTFEHGGVNLAEEHYETVAYWYGIDSACLALTDSLDVADPLDEKLHGYAPTGASETYDLSSRHELGWDIAPIGSEKGAEGWGPMHDSVRRVETFPPVSDGGRRTRAPITFTVQLRKDNLGVLLRRRLDLASPNQKARVLIADPGPAPRWQLAGTWYTAGGNTVVFGDPRSSGQRGSSLEPAPAVSIIETSNRRWREDEFLVPRALTEGRESILIRIEPESVRLPVTPGAKAEDNPWTDFRYWVYSYVMPTAPAPSAAGSR